MFVFVIAISAAVIYFTFDIRALEYLTMFEPWCIAAAFGILGLGLVFDGLRLMTLAAVTDEKLTTRQVVNVVLSNYFLALVTPRSQRRCCSSDHVHAQGGRAGSKGHGRCFCAYDYVDHFFDFAGAVCSA